VELGSDPREIELAAEELGHAFGLGWGSLLQTSSMRPLTRSTADRPGAFANRVYRPQGVTAIELDRRRAPRG
jgi:hypothetical protein